ncbi:MAG: NAD(P)-dependent oxidoreductase [Omnitrophica bacterium]|nr:NAD(P)-dependent oxidoreductase [Candidatus Omnitrophota bacterium]
MKVLITGATGFIGRHLAERLVEEGYEVICAGRSLAKLSALPDKVKTVRIDLERKETIVEAIGRNNPDVVYHCAALVGSRSLKKLLRVNKDGTENVLRACFARGIKKVIYLSSIAVISGNAEVPLTENLPYKPMNPYGRSKTEAEKIALDYRKKGMKIAILRPCIVYGTGEPHGLGLFIGGLRRRVLPIFGKGENRLHLVSIENVVDVLILCLTKDEAYEGTYIVADKEALSIKELFTYITKILGAKTPFVIPEWLTKVFAKIPFIGGLITLFLKDRFYSIEHLKERLGYVPRVSIYDGLKRAIL